MCHVEGAFCFYCEVYTPVVAENERLKAEVKALTLTADAAVWEAVGYTEENETFRNALEWYADYSANYDPMLIDVCGFLPIDQDGGKRAREALGVMEVAADGSDESAS
jgi:hypothetical protein